MFKTAFSILSPIIILFALYVQINGEISPGGGFQAGALVASVIVAYDCIFDKYLFSIKSLSKFSIYGVLIYIFTGFLSIIFDHNFLDYNLFHSNHHKAQAFGIFIIEIGVFLTVSAGLSTIYFSFKNIGE